MSQNKTTIQINGRLYDAHTGALISSDPEADRQNPALQVDKLPAKLKTHHTNHMQTKMPAPEKSKQHVPMLAGVEPTHSQAIHHTPHQRPQRSMTLMRAAVKKPKVPLIHHLQTPAEEAAATVVQPEYHYEHPGRHAMPKVDQSTKISRFGSIVGSQASLIKTVTELDVKPHPVQHVADIEHHQTHLQTALANEHHGHESADARRKRLLHAGLESATAHERPQHARHSRRQQLAHRLKVHPQLINIGAASLVAVLLISFIAYQNATNIALRVASRRSGVSAAAPGYSPAGFALVRPIRYAPGEIRLSFRTHGDQRSYSITQRATEWSTDELRDQYVSMMDQNYQIQQAEGVTVYIYGEGNATWVKNGVWYNLRDQANLGTDQITKIVGSI